MKRVRRSFIVVLFLSCVMVVICLKNVVASSNVSNDILADKRKQAIDAIKLLNGEQGPAFDAVDDLYDVAKKSCQTVESVGTEGAQLKTSLQNALDKNKKLETEKKALQEKLDGAEKIITVSKTEIDRLKKDQQESLAAFQELKKQVDLIPEDKTQKKVDKSLLEKLGTDDKAIEEMVFS